MVLGDKQPLDDHEPPEDGVDVEVLEEFVLVISKAFWFTPVVAALDWDFCDVSDCNSPSADEAAAMNMTKLPDSPQPRPPISPVSVQQAVCQRKNFDKTTAPITTVAMISRQIVPQRQNLPPLRPCIAPLDAPC
jgi:hypothetical protein